MADCIAPSAPVAPALQACLARKTLAGCFLSGLLFSFLGAILPVWRHHLTEDFVIAGCYFLSMNIGIATALLLVKHTRLQAELRARMIIAVSAACAGLLILASIPAASSPWWRIGGILIIGCGAGLLNSGLFQSIAPLYRHEPASTVNLVVTFFGLGCLTMALLTAFTLDVYTVPSILIFIALIPGFFIPAYARCRFPAPEFHPRPAKWRSSTAFLLALVLFFQFGNEWAIAGWLPVYLTQRLGMSPERALILLAVYWLALLVGRTFVLSVMPAVHHGKLLMASVVAALFGCVILMGTGNQFGAVTGILLVGGGFAAVYPLVAAKMGTPMSSYEPGVFNGVFSFALTGGLLAPWSLGWFASLWGIGVVMGLPLLGTIMVFVLLLIIWAEAKFRSSVLPTT